MALRLRDGAAEAPGSAASVAVADRTEGRNAALSTYLVGCYVAARMAEGASASHVIDEASATADELSRRARQSRRLLPMGATVPVEDYLKQFSPEIRAVINAACRVVKAVAPKADERAYRGWPLRYSIDGETTYAIQGYASHVNLLFANGAKLKDAEGLLDGSGKGIRH